MPATSTTHYELRFQSLFNSGRGFSFPCDSQGQVDVDALGERARASYLQARDAVGHELAVPAVQLSAFH